MIKFVLSIALSSVPFAAPLCAQGLGGQISQIHPELCGRPDTTIPLPSNISASFNISDGSAQLLFLREGAVQTRLDLPGVVGQIDEVCPISDQRLLIFASNYAGEVVFLIDKSKSELMDSIWCFQPKLSPNQRWLAYRKFFPKRTQYPASAEYLLYDIQQTPRQNRPAGGSIDDYVDVGQAIFPKGLRNEPFDHLAAPDSRLHASVGSFYWTQDSHMLIFGDSLRRDFSIVAVSITDSGETEAKIHVVNIQDVCPLITSTEDFAVSISGADVEATSTGDRLISVDFAPNAGSMCNPKPLKLNLSEFQEPQTETFIKQKMRKAVVTK
jgi:hypothetical protein